MFVIVTGPPCSGKTTFISEQDDSCAVFKRDGFDLSINDVRNDRLLFIREHQFDKIAFIEASRLGESLKKDFGTASWEEHPMGTDYRECMTRLYESNRKSKDRWAAIIAAYFPTSLSHGEGYDVDLASELIRQRETFGNNRAFYNSRRWKYLRAHIMGEARNQCHDCLAKSPSAYATATNVHHELPIDKHPGWAMSKTWVDCLGMRHNNLVALCHECHDKRHGRDWSETKTVRVDEITKERW